ncbi:BgTH12-04013 [Blumeria graminis f. sp. triticale]|uniref:EKC/KEOPS complex subunit BUD32 n=1 Tax=Blumeria graminis f. sp. triticale TaxID=1689686 RepID=A0A9W4CW83_BLUGR|nr:BgTH12-04013 [Blumeria graminis f. sp. triticale]
MNKRHYPVKNLVVSLKNYIDKGHLLTEDINHIGSRFTKIINWMESTQFDLDPFVPLATLILNHASDTEVWISLLELVDTLEKIIEAQEEKLDNPAAKSMFRRTGITRECFCSKYFTQKSWTNDCIELAKEYVKRSGEDDLKFPTDLDEILVWEWMKNVENKIFHSSKESLETSTESSYSLPAQAVPLLKGTQHRMNQAGTIDGAQSERQVDYYITRRDVSTSSHDWRDILVIGELTKSPTDEFMKKFLQLSALMREVFFAQPLRQFVHGFILFGKSLLLWVYDRSGPYCSSFIDIGQSPQTLVYVMAAYMSMSDAELGLDPNIKYEAHQITVTLDVPGPEKTREFRLFPEPVAQPTTLVTRGTSCYRDLDGGCAKDVDGMVKLVGWRDSVKISQLREGLIFTQAMVKDTRPNDKAMATPLGFTDGFMPDQKKSTSKTTKRKRRGEVNEAGTKYERSSKRARSSAGSSVMAESVTENRPSISLNVITEEDVSCVPGGESTNNAEISIGGDRQSTREKRKSLDSDEVNGRIKRLQLSSNADNGTTNGNSGTSNFPDMEKVMGISPFIFGSDHLNVTHDIIGPEFKVKVRVAWIRDRQSSAVATTPFGRPIHKVESPIELVIGLRDAIKAHRSLLKDAMILHRDISENNIILTGSDVSKDWRGFLIDLDLAVLLSDDKAQRKTQTMTGTMEFMALELLSGSCEKTGAIVNHSYRHDLESFFYVLLWLSMSRGWEKGKEQNRDYLSKWFTGTAKEIFEFKNTQMKESNIEEDVLNKFSPKFYGLRRLAKEFWRIIFLTNGTFFIGSYKDNNALYNSTMAAFDKEIQRLIV